MNLATLRMTPTPVLISLAPFIAIFDARVAACAASVAAFPASKASALRASASPSNPSNSRSFDNPPSACTRSVMTWYSFQRSCERAISSSNLFAIRWVSSAAAETSTARAVTVSITAS
ncbi:hypothetical protein CPB85DRAFT_900547 [Mucidula mucida]|nr:hypothetical protein CPB85DRAFT_900547 [Mucidula mucida]